MFAFLNLIYVSFEGGCKSREENERGNEAGRLG